MKLVADTGGIISAIVSSETDHHRFRATLERASVAIVSPLVVTEVHYLLTATGEDQAAHDFLEDVAGGFYQLEPVLPQDFTTANLLIQKYHDRIERKKRKPGSIDLADAMNIILAYRCGTNLILATDQDYRIVEPLTGHGYFRILPFDDEPEA